MKELEYLMELIDSYLVMNPNSQDPVDFVYVFGIDNLISILEKANGRPINFVVDTDAYDKIDPYIDGKVVEF